MTNHHHETENQTELFRQIVELAYTFNKTYLAPSQHLNADVLNFAIQAMQHQARAIDQEKMNILLFDTYVLVQRSFPNATNPEEEVFEDVYRRFCRNRVALNPTQEQLIQLLKQRNEIDNLVKRKEFAKKHLYVHNATEDVLHKYRWWVFPINILGSSAACNHWSLTVYDSLYNQFYALDSINSALLRSSQSFLMLQRVIAKFRTENNFPYTISATIIPCDWFIKQSDGWSCGTHVLQRIYELITCPNPYLWLNNHISCENLSSSELPQIVLSRINTWLNLYSKNETICPSKWGSEQNTLHSVVDVSNNSINLPKIPWCSMFQAVLDHLSCLNIVMIPIVCESQFFGAVLIDIKTDNCRSLIISLRNESTNIIQSDVVTVVQQHTNLMLYPEHIIVFQPNNQVDFNWYQFGISSLTGWSQILLDVVCEKLTITWWDYMDQQRSLFIHMSTAIQQKKRIKCWPENMSYESTPNKTKRSFTIISPLRKKVRMNETKRTIKAHKLRIIEE